MERLRWFTEMSELFMSRGYFNEGKDIHSTIEDIAEHSRAVLGKDEEYKQKLKKYIELGWYIEPTPVWKNFNPYSKESPISCVTGDTWINTDKGGKQAKDIQIGDLVLTHKNRFRKVINVIPTKDKNDIWKLKVNTRMTNLYITGNHPVLTNLGWVRVDELDVNKHLVAVNADLKYNYPDIRNNTSYNYITEDGLMYCPIEVLEKTDKIEDVYDFTVEEDHSFSCAGVVVHNCFGVYVGDNVESIILKSAEVALQNKIGGGTSGTFSDVRPRGSKIQNSGKSNGAVSMMEIYQAVSKIISQPNRRGHFAATLDLSHGDADEFLGSLRDEHPIQSISTSVAITDEFMEKLLAGDKIAYSLMQKVIKSRYETGYPYIFFKDTANRNKPEIFEGKTIHHSNMCVTGDQLVVTDKGLRRVIDLYTLGEDLVLFDGEKSVKASKMKLIEENVPVFKITTNSGREHTVTDYHKVKTTKGMIECKDLKIGDKIYIQRKKGLFGSIHNPEKAFLLGLYQGDGTQQENGTVFIDLWEKDFDLIDTILDYSKKVFEKDFTFYDCKESVGGFKKKRLNLGKVDFKKGYIPTWILEADEVTQWSYLKGLFISDGTSCLTKGRNNNPLDLSLCSIDKDFLKTIQIILSNLGINARIYKGKSSGKYNLPDGKGGYKEYNCKSTFRLKIGSKSQAIIFNKNTGFLDRKGVVLENSYRDNSIKFDTVISIQEVGRENVYCTTVDSTEHVWTCNSFITSNCMEIMLPNNEKETFVCCLLGMNLEYFDEWKNTDAVEIGVYFMDSMLQDFLNKMEKKRKENQEYYNVLYKPAVEFVQKYRALGMGSSGLHSYLQSKNIPFYSLTAMFHSTMIQKTIQTQAIAASEKMAMEYGRALAMEGTDVKRRHATLTAIAPNTSSSFIKNMQSQSIEPYISNYYVKDVSNVKTPIKNPYLEKLLEEKGYNTNEVWESILKNSGSVQHLDFLSQDEKDVFRTFAEIPQDFIIEMAAKRQQYICQSQSLNLMIGKDVEPDYIVYLILKAWKLGIKSLYYQLNVNQAQEFTKNKECVACAG